MDLEYSDADFSNLTTYKLFRQTFMPRIQAENPKVPMFKLMILVDAKWRKFISLGPAEEEENEDVEEEEAADEEQEQYDTAEDDDEEEIPVAAWCRRSRGVRPSHRKPKKVEENESDYNDDDSDDDVEDSGDDEDDSDDIKEDSDIDVDDRDNDEEDSVDVEDDSVYDEDDSDDGQNKRGRPGHGKSAAADGDTSWDFWESEDDEKWDPKWRQAREEEQLRSLALWGVKGREVFNIGPQYVEGKAVGLEALGIPDLKPLQVWSK